MGVCWGIFYYLLRKGQITMPLNSRQLAHVERVQIGCKLGNILYDLCAQVKEANDEEFAAGQLNAIATEDLEEEVNVTLGKLTAAVNLYCGSFINFWEGGAVSTRQYGKEARYLMTHRHVRLPTSI